MLIMALFTTAKKVEAPQHPLTYKWINKIWPLHTTIIQPLKGRKFRDTTTWMNLEDTTLSEIHQAQKDKYCMSPLR